MLRPHIVWPVQLGSDGRILTAEQDSDREVASCLATCVLWPLGTRELIPDFGVEDPLFRQGGTDLDHVRQQLLINEPRVEVTVGTDDPALQGFVERVNVGFDQSAGEPVL